ncbi:hypothetical protein PsorP6_007082 [Peronosclerospora sorghi]|uniref:Uncharacterized protein n=1 Tax=Peronosclerospora sorghi TaxID=230839 RepID=A0ACC0W996_9STRA|nr:hypothetical protein PsorP6_007082 [Peronosclerospora sorghi]
MNVFHIVRVLSTTLTLLLTLVQSQVEPKAHDPLLLSELGAKTNNLRASVELEPLILGGTIVPSKTKLYTASLRRTKSGKSFCGGSLITPTHVLTAAHCLPGKIQYVSVGSHFAQGTEDGEQLQVIQATRHPRYRDGSHAYDFMVLELEQASSFAPVALAKADESDMTYAERGTVMGWGAMAEGGFSSPELLRVDVPLMNATECAKVLDIDHSMLCAGGDKNIDSCQGDSGGPLILEEPFEDVLIGVVSWGEGCGRPGSPGVYAKVSIVTEWLAKVAPGVQFR